MVGILTWFNRDQNCGQTLQAFALQNALGKELGSKNVILLKYHYGFRKIYLVQGVFQLYDYYGAFRRGQIRRKRIFDDFIKSNMRCSKSLFTEKQLVNYIDENEITGIVLGSDQIWNPQSGCIPEVMKLNIPREIRKVSYSPSMCSSNCEVKYSTEIKKIAEAIKGFDYIGVREKSARQILQKYIKSEINVLLDPVFLMNYCEWKDYCIEGYAPEEDYILIYCVGIVPNNIESAIKTVQFRHNITKVLFVITNKGQLLRDEWVGLKNVGPAEFISLVLNATYIFCDSFHMTAFSIIFRKNFYVFPAKKRDYIPNPERILDLLDMFGLSDRYVCDIDSISDIDYTEKNKIISQMIAHTQSELKKICSLFANEN